MTEEEIKALHKEFKIHFKNCPDELQFLEAFIEDLLQKKKREVVQTPAQLRKKKEYDQDMVDTLITFLIFWRRLRKMI